jgi:hypothetical protein
MSRSPERSEGEGSGSPDAEILRCAQDDNQDTSQARSREALSPNVYGLVRIVAATNLVVVYSGHEHKHTN